jgi:outer membrane protein assembly factor BamB
MLNGNQTIIKGKSGCSKVFPRHIARQAWPRGVLLMSLFFGLASMICGPRYAEGACAWENKIAVLDPLKQDDLVAFNAALTTGSVLDYCKVREKLLSLTYEEFQDLISCTDKNNSLKTLHNLLERTLPSPEDIYLLKEEIFINNVPFLGDSPFYSKVLSGALVTDLKPQAEQVYVNNLKLTYQKNDLTKKGDDLWLGPRTLKQETVAGFCASQDQPEMFSWIADQRVKSASQSWSWQLKDDYRHDYFSAIRQYMKHYEEPTLQPVIYKNAVITRNAYRFFCLYLPNAKELWSIGPDNGGQEFYHTFRHPHHNSYGDDFLFCNGIVFSELNGKLVAVDLTDICRPSLKWTRELGEYTLCTKPALIGNKLICGLVNARGEVWFCGFDAQTGILAWSRYIGLSSFLAPACTLMAVTTADAVVIGTNHGVLACLIPDSGEIVWLKKYTPRRYSSVDYWWKGYYKDVFWETGSLPYDTQFLEQADNGLIYYKPRESDYLYTINAGNGETVQKLYVDPSFLSVLGVYDSKVAFLRKTVSPLVVDQVVIADLRTGAELSTVIIPGGKLKGVLYPKASQVIFKVDEILYTLDFADTRMPLRKIPLHEPGWLLGASEQAAIIGENRIVKCLKFNIQTGPKNTLVQDQIAGYLKNRERVKNEFRQIDKTCKVNGQISRLLEEIRQAGLSVNDVFSTVQNNLGRMRESACQGFLEGLNNIYGRSVITYRDIQMTLNSFLNGSGLMPHTLYQKPSVSKPNILSAAKKEYQFHTGNTVLLAVNVIRGADPANFFILLNNGQIVCVGEKGDIRWEKKIFFGPIWQSDMEEDKDWHLYSDDIEVYLYDNTLIINDRVNIIAVDVNTGAYIWSMTNKREVLNDASQFPSGLSTWSYAARLYFIKHIMIRIQFIQDVLIVSHGDMLYALDPRTGYCQASCRSGIPCVMDMRTADERLYVVSDISKAQIKVFNKNLEEIGGFSSTSIGENKNFWPQLVLLPHYVLLHLRPKVYIFDKKNGRLMYTLDIGDLKRYYIEPHNDGFIVIAPFLKTYGYRVKNGIPEKEWEYPLEPQDQRLIWDLPSLRSAYYLMAKDCLLNFIRKGDDYWVVALDWSTGKRLWQTKLAGIQGRFYNLSGSIQSQGRLQFVMTCVYTNENYTSDLNLASRLSKGAGVYSVDVDSTLFSLDIAKGILLQAQRLPSSGLIGFPREDVIQTQDFYQYNLYRTSIKCVGKKEQ